MQHRDDGFIGLAVALEQNSSLQILNLREIILVSMALWHWQRAEASVLQQIALGRMEVLNRSTVVAGGAFEEHQR
jgi:hypothetical protein